MLTPRFNIEQTEDTIIITILAPYTNLKDTDIHVLDQDFRFYSAPYYLRLTLPGKVIEGENSSAKHHVESKSFIITLDKIIAGEVFPNLQMLTVMLQPKVDEPSTSAPPIEVLSSNDDTGSESFEIEPQNWFINQTFDELRSEQLLQQFKYGFAGKHSGLGTKYEVELNEVAEIKNPDSLSPYERHILQEEAENDKFSDDHYFQDLMVTDLSTVMAYALDLPAFQELTDSDRDQLQSVTNQEFLLDKNDHIQLFLGVGDIIFAFLYDLRVNEGKTCIESPWNISRVSSTFSFFQIFDHMHDMVRSCVRRSLVYPLYRHWDLILKVLEDTHTIITAGKVPMLKCLLAVQKVFKSKEPFYLLNQLYIDEFCVWIQQSSETNWESFALGFQEAVGLLQKESIGFDLYYLDIAAKVTMDEAMEDEMSEQISGIEISAQP